MKRSGFITLGAALVAVSMMSAGCCKKEKETIAALQGQYNELSARNKDIQSKLAQAKAKQMDLESQAAQLGVKNTAILNKDREIARLKSELQKQSALAAQQKPTGQWDVGRHADRISVGSDILFDSGRAKLTAKGRGAIDKVVADIKSRYASLPVRVYGYTDSDPIKRTKKLWTDNLDLSANRAMAVTRYLTSKGISAEKVETVAMGSTRFVAKNDTRTSKAKNRRVEIVVIKD